MTSNLVAAPEVKVTVSPSEIGVPSSVPATTDEPATADEVKVAVYVPLPLSTTEEIVPCEAPSETTPPLAVRLLPLASLS